MNNEHCIEMLSRRYAQLILPIAEGMRNTEEYRDAVLRGNQPAGSPDFSFCSKDSFTAVNTPAGVVEILYLHERDDFIHALRALAHRCEPVDIPDSIGAVTISGLYNWEKIRAHRIEYLAAGGSDWGSEFEAFTSDRSNFTDTLIILSRGPYSNVMPDGFDEEEWLERSLIIRKYHELTHFVYRKFYPEWTSPVLDEVVADMVGITAAFGCYRTDLARLFLGIEGDTYRKGGRLEYYLDGNDPLEKVDEINSLIAMLESE